VQLSTGRQLCWRTQRYADSGGGASDPIGDRNWQYRSLDGSIYEMLRELGMIGGNGQDRTATADQMEVSDAA
jgi:hypothetical protein